MAMKQKQEFEAKEEEMRKQIEKLEVEAELKAVDAEIAVLERYSDGMSSYLSRGIKSITTSITNPQQTELSLATKPKIPQSKNDVSVDQHKIPETQSHLHLTKAVC